MVNPYPVASEISPAFLVSKNHRHRSVEQLFRGFYHGIFQRGAWPSSEECTEQVAQLTVINGLVTHLMVWNILYFSIYWKESYPLILVSWLYNQFSYNGFIMMYNLSYRSQFIPCRQLNEFINGIVTSRTKAMSGWWYIYPSETYEFVSWDDSSQV